MNHKFNAARSAFEEADRMLANASAEQTARRTPGAAFADVPTTATGADRSTSPFLGSNKSNFDIHELRARLRLVALLSRPTTERG